MVDRIGEQLGASSPSYRWSFDDVVKKGLSKDKANRFGSALELAEAMLRALGLDPGAKRWASTPGAEI